MRKQSFLVVGGGGREHAVVRKLKESPLCGEIFCAPGNAGIAEDAVTVPVSAADIAGIVNLAKEKAVDLVFVAPDDPLAAGMVDALEAAGIRAFGPTAAAAKIESEKAFAKNLMRKYGIPTADFTVFDDAAAAREFVLRAEKFPLVLKANGLALGKGVIIAQTREEALAAVEDLMERRVFGDSGSKIVAEEFLTGPEVSVLALCDGKTVKPLVSVMDHKRALDGDRGPNTGGMGTVAPNPFYTPAIHERCVREIFEPTVRAMEAEGRPFKGCLFFGLMLTADGPKVIEYNARFGDPETQVVLPLLDSDFLELVNAVVDGTLAEREVRFQPAAAACVILASGGYPGSYETGLPIDGLDEHGRLADAQIFHAGTKRADGRFVTAGGRVLGVTALGPNLNEALERAYGAAERISFRNMHYRKDIGSRCRAMSDPDPADSPQNSKFS